MNARITAGQLVDALRVLSATAHSTASARGFYHGTVSVGERLMLMVRALSLAMGDVKRSRPLSEVKNGPGGKPYGFPIKLADVVISVADLAGYLGIDLGAAVSAKLAWNARRAHKAKESDGKSV